VGIKLARERNLRSKLAIIFAVKTLKVRRMVNVYNLYKTEKI